MKAETINPIDTLHWFKSSHSSGAGGQCVEVAAAPDAVHVRDSKDAAGPALTFSRDAWAAFTRFAAQQ